MKEPDFLKEKKRLKKAGYILMAAAVAGIVAGSKTGVWILLFVILADYAIYIRYYPYIYVEFKKGQRRNKALELPVLGSCFALGYLTLDAYHSYNFDVVDMLKMMLCLAAVLAVPWVIKSKRIKAFQEKKRMLLVVLSILMISFGMTLPLNYVLTFDKPTHKTIYITEKGKRDRTYRSPSNYWLYSNVDGEEVEFSVSRTLYNSTHVGDARKICENKSIFGFKWNVIHE